MICITPTCERKATCISKTLCTMHYKRLKKHGTTDKYERVPKNRTCSFGECNKKHDSHGFCTHHARQFKKYGYVPSKEEISAKFSALKKGNKYTKGKTWKLPDDKKHKGVCRNTGKSHFAKGFVPWNRGISKYSSTENITNRQQRLAFRKIRNLVVSRDNSICQICQSYTEYAQVDHIKKWSDYPELRFELSNCRTLCMPCHYYITYKRKLPEGNFWGHRSQTT